ncbi:DNA/RNA non-specific endonuclease [Sphingorhabdus sp.]|uniref:DNA/RNA non-specific endonuclease n=1 Tax=Sphingorhabdus sp. TaxID=1902408 RepID=UPI003D8183CF
MPATRISRPLDQNQRLMEVPSYNHFAQNARFNLSEYRIIENKWKKALKAGKNVTVDIQATYTSNSRRPDWIFVFSNIGGIDEIDRMPNKK